MALTVEQQREKYRIKTKAEKEDDKIFLRKMKNRKKKRLNKLKANPPKKKKVKKVNYYEYIRSPRWFRKRLAALKYHGNYCRICNTHDNLHVHHLTYKNLGREKMADLTILCAEHHNEFHEEERASKELNRKHHK